MGKAKKKKETAAKTKSKDKSEDKALEPKPAAKTKSKDKALEPKPVDKKKETPPFISMCGLPFDSAKGSECTVLCSDTDPDEYAKCLADFKANPVKPETKPTTKNKGKNKWGRQIGSQAALIEDVLDNEKPMTTEAIAKKAGCTVSRVRRHFLRLIHKEKQTSILISKKGLVFLPTRFPKLKGESAYPKPTKRTT